MANIEQDQIKRAKHFFEDEYKERGMVKWQGYYLSDHTEDVTSYTQSRQAKMNIKLMPEMGQENISKTLYSAYGDNSVVSIQEKAIIDGLVPAIISGHVKGYDEEYVFIGDIRISIDSINWIEKR